MDKTPSLARRNKLLEIESMVTTWWEEGDVFVAKHRDQPPAPGEKFFGNFPFPYMNGYLHLGHAFSISKVEFAASFHRLTGANVLFPFGFHCTGMPIKAAADKLAKEIQQFGDPPEFPYKMKEEVEQSVERVSQPAPGKFTGKKSKVVVKSSTQLHQWEIMRSFGLSDEEIAKFQDPYEWVTYFPPLAVEDLKAFGLGCDWRRTFVTTDINPYFDSFVRWHMRKLKEAGKIVKDLRYTIFSPLDGQPCADHDRASGEGVQPQEYTLIKMKVVSPFPAKLSALEGKKVFLVAATLRPETMYGQTNAWILPEGKYGAFEVNETDVFIMTERAALNLAYQRYSRIPEKPTRLVSLMGFDLIGLPLKSPLTSYEIIYALPMLTILMDVGTGIVTSVPSDAPDDYMALHDLKTKLGLRAKYGVRDEWVLPLDIISIIDIPKYGARPAEKVCFDFNIKSQNDKNKLVEAKNLFNLKDFTEGTMLVGEFTGEKVQDAKPKVKKLLLDENQAIVYSEPEKKVMSRSGVECVVALTDQWYITYGEFEWKKLAEECLMNMNLYSEETRHSFEKTMSWLNQWACSRSFGLGTYIPWDEQYLVESLSDSTIYMAYYTVAHFLQNGNIYGLNAATSLIKPEYMTDAVWDYLFCGGQYPESSDIEASVLSQMKQEFEYWYPFDLRVSGKDLTQNHLTFCIYNHTAIMDRRHWPRGFRCNGHIMLNSEKMSKSTGNFRTLRQAIEEFSADATRFALADAGDGVDDSNFVFGTASNAILELTKEIAWMEQIIIGSETALRPGTPSTLADRLFQNEINVAIKLTEQHYQNYMFRAALISGFRDLQTARNDYRSSCGDDGMNRDLIWRFMDVQTRLITPICPHYGEYVWRKLLKKEGFAVKAGWPVGDEPDPTLQQVKRYLHHSMDLMNKRLQKRLVGGSKMEWMGLIYVSERYEGWKEECLKILRSKFDSKAGAFAPLSEIIPVLQKSEIILRQIAAKQILKVCMSFMKFKMDEVHKLGSQALELKLPFSEIKVLSEYKKFIKRQLGLKAVEIILFEDSSDVAAKTEAEMQMLFQHPPSPGNPCPIFIESRE